MAKLKLHYDGWLSLPADLRQQLGLSTGDRVEAELVTGAIVLRPASKGRRPKRHEAVVAVPSAEGAAGIPALSAPTVPAKRKPGRPRKVIEAEALAPAATEPRRPRGRPRKVPLTPEREPVLRPVVTVGPAKLLKKADLPPKTTSAGPTALPADTTKRTNGDGAYHLEEQRPFRHVEVRKLGPGRGHNQSRQRVSGSAV